MERRDYFGQESESEHERNIEDMVLVLALMVENPVENLEVEVEEPLQVRLPLKLQTKVLVVNHLPLKVVVVLVLVMLDLLDQEEILLIILVKLVKPILEVVLVDRMKVVPV